MKALRSARPTDGLGAAAVSLAASLGLLVGMRAVAAFQGTGLRSLLTLRFQPEEGFGLMWSPRAVWPAEVQADALEGMVATLAGLLLAGAVVGLLNCLIVLVEAGAARRQELAVRVAVGASTGRLVVLLLGPVRRVLTTAGALGLLLGLVAGGLLRLTWPGLTQPPGFVEATGELLAPVLLLTLLTGYAYAGVGLRLEARRSVATQLGHGGRLTDDSGAVAFRRALAALQMGAAGSVAVAGLFLASGLSEARTATQAEASVGVVAATRDAGIRGQSWEAVLAAVGDIPGVEAESLATPGALVGLGVRDYATSDCGNCQRGDLIVRFIPTWVDHHAVAPGFFELAGQALLEGRDFTPSDASDAPLVAVVNRTYANSAFENGEAIGRTVRLGRGRDDWFTVVGIVEDAAAMALGATVHPQEAVYVNALQRPPVHAEVLARIEPAADPDVAPDLTAPLAALGLEVGAESTVSAVRRAARSPQRWAAGFAGILASVILALAAFGTRAVTRQVARRQEHELAVRRVMGATDRQILAFVLGGSARSAAWGTAVTLFFGSLTVAFLREGLGAVPSAGPGVYALVAGILGVTALTASWEAARAALRVEPVGALE